MYCLTFTGFLNNTELKIFGRHWLPAEVLSTNGHLPEVIHTVGLYPFQKCVCRRFAVARACRACRPATPPPRSCWGLARPWPCLRLALVQLTLTSPVAAVHTPPTPPQHDPTESPDCSNAHTPPLHLGLALLTDTTPLTSPCHSTHIRQERL